MAFENDIFISYAHLDDESILEGQKGWVSSFHRVLEIRVGQLLGEKPRIWRDPKLQGNDYFADTLLAERLPRAATLVSVLSPRYAQSEWCTKELHEFCRLSAETGGVRIADKARIFKVVKTPIPPEQHPAELAPLLGYEFFEVERETGRPRELSLDFGPEAERRFLARIDDLAYDLCQLLGLLKGGVPAPREPRATVYLAETSFDLKDEREAVQRDLQRAGCTVLPDRPLQPLVRDEIAAIIAGQVARATLSVHLVGKSYGIVPDGGPESVVVLQNQVAAQRGREAGLPRLLWLPPGLTVEDERQKAFVERLRTDPDVAPGTELLETPLEDLKSAIHGRLAPKPKPPMPTQTGLKRIYLLSDGPDAPAVGPLVDYLFDRGFEVVQPLFEGEEDEVRRDHEESLCTCDAVLLFYGTAGEIWLRRKLRDLQRAPGLGRAQPFLARGIYVAPPATPEKERLRTLEAFVLRAPAAGFDPETLAPFLAKIASKSARPAS
ncbi:MAG TPA: hypothetical protein VFE33_05340 [Thermoanaerobaculia bacterium]|nr:hypothetical protein [Thermoanaerobaculia bacterium]